MYLKYLVKKSPVFKSSHLTNRPINNKERICNVIQIFMNYVPLVAIYTCTMYDKLCSIWI